MSQPISKRPWLTALGLGVMMLSQDLALAASNVEPANSVQSISSPEPIKVDTRKARLGKRLFYDVRLSGNSAVSCATCHQPDKGFANSQALSPAYPGNNGFRNTPSLINTAYKKQWFHDGRIDTNLNDVTRENITEDYVMNMDMGLMQERLKQDPVYVEMFRQAGYGEPSSGAVRKAIPEFMKTLVSRNAPYDTGNMSEAAIRGEALFNSKGQCVSCHHGSLFSDGKAWNTGVPENPQIFKDPLSHSTFIAFNMFMGNENSMNLKRDVGAHVQSHKADGTDMGKFMTPSLRELIYTAPYMHNGMMATLEDVIDFYNQGGGVDKNKDPRLQSLGLTLREKKDLVEFLEALSGDPLTGDEFVWFKNDYSYQLIDDWTETQN